MNKILQRKKSFQANDLIHDQFIVLGKLDNKKHSSTILKGFDKTSGRFVVIKITSAGYREKNKNVTKILQKLCGGNGVPKILWRGMEGPNTITVTDCLGPNLKKLFLLMDKHFSIASIAMIAMQVLTTLEYIHGQDYVCCNIMPKEILISLQKTSLMLFITDYKQARKVKKGKIQNHEQVSHAINKSILNKFSSINLHLGLPASKKDDLESLAYILVYFFKRGSLFERQVRLSKEEKIKFYEQQKLSIVPETFCHGLPTEMGAFLTYIKSIQTNQMEEKVDYEYLKRLFKTLFNKYSSLDVFQYDWMSKAITYNLDKNGEQKHKNSSELQTRNDLITFQSSKCQESEVFSEMDPQTHTHTETVNLPSYVININGQQSESDFYEVDEFEVSSLYREPISVNKIGLFEEKIKTITYVKSNSTSANSSPIGKNLTNFNSEDKEDYSTKEKATSDMSLDRTEDFKRLKGKSATEVNKISRFGTIYVGNKLTKSS